MQLTLNLEATIVESDSATRGLCCCGPSWTSSAMPENGHPSTFDHRGNEGSKAQRGPYGQRDCSCFS